MCDDDNYCYDGHSISANGDDDNCPLGLLNEVLDEIEPITVEESKIAFKKKKAQRKDKFSRFEL